MGQYGTYEFRQLGGPCKVNTSYLTRLGPRHIQKGSLLCMIGHRTLSTQPHLVISNGCDDEFWGNIVTSGNHF